MSRRLRHDGGFALLVVIGSMVVLTIFLLSTFSYVMHNMAPSRADQDNKAAVAAAQAGIEEYLARLNLNDTYWTSVDCGNLALVSTSTTCAVPRPPAGVPVPGSTAGGGTYSYRLLSNSASTSKDGLVRLEVTGRSNGRSRQLIAELAPSGFLDYIYFSDFESVDPALSREVADPAAAGYPDATLNGQPYLKNTSALTYTFWWPRLSGTAGPCGTQHWYEGRSAPTYTSGQYLEYVYKYQVNPDGTESWVSRVSGPTSKPAAAGKVVGGFGCEEIQFTTGDTIAGPLKTNDAMLVNGSPKFTSPVTETAWLSAPDASKPWRGSGTPDPGTATAPGYRPVIAGALPMPDSNAELINAATTSPTGCVYTGVTRFAFTDNGRMSVRSPGTSGAVARCYPGGNGPAIVDVPSVVYVKESTAACSNQLGFPAGPESLNEGATTDYNCKRGNAYVSGVLKGRVTIATANDVVIVGDTTYLNGMTGTDVLGLIPQNYAWIYHPVRNSGSNILTTPITKVDAAILSVNHSFLVQNWDVGAKLSVDDSTKLQIRGAIAQRFRGPVGTGGSGPGGTGYLKTYEYDKRLRNSPPPYFLRPVISPYTVQRVTD